MIRFVSILLLLVSCAEVRPRNVADLHMSECVLEPVARARVKNGVSTLMGFVSAEKLELGNWDLTLPYELSSLAFPYIHVDGNRATLASAWMLGKVINIRFNMYLTGDNNTTQAPRPVDAGFDLLVLDCKDLGDLQ